MGRGLFLCLVLLAACERPRAWAPSGPVATGCDLGVQRCRVELGGGRALELTAAPRPVPALEPVEFSARFSGGVARAVSLTLTGEQMDMGQTRLGLEARDGGFVGRGSLPVCTVDAMTWRARLDFELDGVPASRSFTFETRRATTPATRDDAVERLDGPLVDFTLQTARGPVRLSDFRGKVVLVYFGYTFCPDICPTSLAATARALRELPPADLAKVQTLFVSVDPERDTPEHLAEYARFFHPSIIGATGTPEQVARAARPFEVVYAKHATGGASGYVVDHSALTYLVAPDGHLVARLPHAARAPLVLGELAKWLPAASTPAP
ncbi:MAG: SCO family protein [Myxococcota bacterium]